MNRMPIFLGISDREIPALIETGSNISMRARFYGRAVVISGEVIDIRQMEHGKIVLLKRSRYSFTGIDWAIIPLWIGCGGNGVIASWKCTITQKVIEEYELRCEWEEWCADMVLYNSACVNEYRPSLGFHCSRRIPTYAGVKAQ